MTTWAIDSETYLITPEDPTPKPVCVSFANDKQSYLLTVDDAYEDLVKLFTNDDLLIFHSASYDTSVFAKYYGPEMAELIFRKYERKQIVCTKLNEKLFRLEKTGDLSRSVSFSLAQLVLNYFEKDISESKNDPNAWRLRYSELDGVPVTDYPEEASKYAISDAEYALDVYEAQLEEYGKPKEDLWIQVHVDFCTRIMTTVGISTDQEYIKVKKTKFMKIIDECTEILVKRKLKIPKSKKDPTLKKDMKAIRELITKIYATQDQLPPMTEGKKVKTDRETLADMEGHDVGIDALARIGKVEKMVTTYLKAWEGHDLIHSSYDVLKETGRMSSEKPNMQNIPRKHGMRGCFLPREGYYFCAVDYSQIELCALAQVLKLYFVDFPKVEMNLLQAINEDKDLHILMASNLLDLSYERTLELYKDGDEEIKEYRQLSKALNFGIPGGIGAPTFIHYASDYGVDISLEQSQNAIDIFFETFPEVKSYLNSIGQSKKDKSFYVNHYFTDRVRRLGSDGFCATANCYFQGMAADGIKRALIDVTAHCYFEPESLCYGSLPVVIVHDEIIFEVPKENSNDIAQYLSSIMVFSMQTIMPDVKTLKAEPVLMDRWYKEAEPTYDKEGFLIPWTPEKENQE